MLYVDKKLHVTDIFLRKDFGRGMSDDSAVFLFSGMTRPRSGRDILYSHKDKTMNIFNWIFHRRNRERQKSARKTFSEQDEQCEVCDKHVNVCICQECPKCGIIGDPSCYLEHGLMESEEQRESCHGREIEYLTDDDLTDEFEDEDYFFEESDYF